MNYGHCHSNGCGHHGCGRHHGGCGNVLGTTTCGCVAGDGTPACNPWAPWGRVAGDNTCGCTNCSWGGWVAGDTTCGGCGTCGACGSTGCWGCGNTGCGACGNAGCGSCGSVAGDSTAACLTPRYVPIGRTFQRRITQTLCVDDLPECAESPLTLVGVTVSGQASWEQLSECRQQLLRVTVPVAVQIRDCSGRCRTGHATVTLTIPLCGNCPAQDFWRGQLYVAAGVRLAAPVTENEDGCFDATLEVQATVYQMHLHASTC